VICNFVCFAPRIAYLVGPVEPVELRGIRPAQVEPPGGTGGTALMRQWNVRPVSVPPVTPASITKNRRKVLKYHRFHRLHLPDGGPRASLESIP
jgi:hypothetical protein